MFTAQRDPVEWLRQSCTHMVMSGVSCIATMSTLDVADSMAAKHHPWFLFAGKARRWATVVDLERRMLVAGVRPDVVTFTALITACQACTRWEDAERRWAAMLTEGAGRTWQVNPPCSVTY